MNIKHSMCFSYDSDKSGAIDKKEMTRVMKSVYAMLGTKGSDKSSLDERVHSSILTKVPSSVWFKKSHAKVKQIISRPQHMQQGFSRM